MSEWIKAKEWIAGPLLERVEKEYTLDEIRQIFSEGDLWDSMADKIESHAAEIARLRGVLQDIKDGNADGCPDCKYNEGVAEAALKETER